MKINKSFKIRIYPNKTQTELIEKTFGCVRFIYNKMLEERLNAYKKYKDDRNKLWTYKCKTEKELKNEFDFLKEVDSISLQQSNNDLSLAYQNFFRSLKKKQNVGFPKFHKKGIKDSYRTFNIKVDFDNKKIKLPKLKWIKYRDDRNFNDYIICSATISKTSTNKYFVSILCEKEIEEVKKSKITNDSIIKGLDMSMNKFYVDNENNSPEYIRLYRKYESRLKVLQRRASKKKKGSNNKRKAQFKVNKIVEKIANSRKDFVEKLSNDIIKKNDVIVIESLNIKGMAQSLKFGKSANDLGWGLFVNRLEQKIKLTPKTLIKADKWFASSQICHVCGYQNKSLTLADREWECPSCHSHILRDNNAAINLVNYARQELSSELVEMPSVEGSKKQESHDFNRG